MKPAYIYVKTVLVMALFLSFGVFAAEVVSPGGVADPAQAPQPWWATLILSLVSLVLTTFAVPFLHARKQAEDAKIAALEKEAVLTTMQQRELLSARLKSFLLRTAGIKVERDFPKLAQMVLDKRLNNVDAIKAELYRMGADLKQDAILYFGNQGIDLVAAVGDKYLDDLVRWAADKVSPFPGKDTAVTLLTDTVSNKIVDYGVHYFKSVIPPATPLAD